MHMRFVKMEGAGNDYVYVDCFRQTAPAHPEELSVDVSRPHFGIGADGLVLIEPSEVADAKMRIFNADGSEAQMCGNGLRCVAKYLHDAGIVKGLNVTVETPAGVRAVDLIMQDGACVGARAMMGVPAFTAESLFARFDGDSWIDRPVAFIDKEVRITCVSMGNPHAVSFVKEIPEDDIFVPLGRALETLPMFLQRTNVEFVKVVSSEELEVRVWERGSGETLACGSGACASLVASVLTGRAGRKARVRLKGGDLSIEWNERDGNVYMTGPARTVFTGEYL